MPSVYKLLIESHFLPHDLGKKKRQYGKISLFDWEGDLSKQWYVYYSYRHPITGKLTRQNNLYGHINSFDSLKDRRREAAHLIEALEQWLDEGNSPYNAEPRKPKTISLIQNAREAIEFALTTAERTYAESSYPDFKSRVRQFREYLENRNMLHLPMKEITRLDIVDFLHLVLQRSSARNRNNTRTAISSLYTILKGNYIVQENFIEEIPVLTSKPTKNKSFNTDQEQRLADLLETAHYKVLGLYIKFIAFGMLRPIEICRLKVEDISIKDKTMRLKAKNQATKTKIIPSILFDQLPDLSRYNRTDYVFTPGGPGAWETKEVNRRNHFSEWFSQVKKELGLSAEYTAYSFRHTYVIKMYKELRKEYAPFEAKTRLMHITGHSTMKALDAYLREIDAELPDDFSHLLRPNSKNGK